MVAVGSTFGIGVFVAVGGNQTTVGVGVWEGAKVAVGVGGISVGGAQETSTQAARMQISKLTPTRNCL